jgi:hypothetical protein
MIGPECEAAPPNDPVLEGAPVIGPDFLDFEPSTGISNILPNSPDLLISPPVYGMATELIVGALSFGCSGRPDT